MTAHPDLALAVLFVHLAVINFNLFGLVAIPLGGWLGWRFVRAAGFRWLHLASMAVVAVQALAGRACFLTILQGRLAGDATAPMPLIAGLIDRMIFWPLPLPVFAVIYVGLLIYVVALLWLVPVQAAPVSRGRAG